MSVHSSRQCYSYKSVNDMIVSTVGSAEQAVNVLSSVGEQRVVVVHGEPHERPRDGLPLREADRKLGHGGEPREQRVDAQLGLALLGHGCGLCRASKGGFEELVCACSVLLGVPSLLQRRDE